MYRNATLSAALPRKWIWQRLLFAALLGLSLFLIYAERSQKDWIAQLRMSLMQGSAPLAQLLASPGQAIEDLSTGWAQLWQVHGENRQLRHDNAQLMQWRDVALRLEAENAALRQLMQYQMQSSANYTSAKVISGAGNGVSHRLLINIGSDQGAEKHMPIVGAQGLVGRTLSVAGGTSEVMLLTDIGSRIPVVLQPSGERAILVGDHSKLPFLKLENPKAKLTLGEVVMSSDDGGLLPEGLHVGTLFAERDGRLQVRPAFHGKRLDYVRVLERR